MESLPEKYYARAKTIRPYYLVELKQPYVFENGLTADVFKTIEDVENALDNIELIDQWEKRTGMKVI